MEDDIKTNLRSCDDKVQWRDFFDDVNGLYVN
jgi:hypothetical protein